MATWRTEIVGGFHDGKILYFVYPLSPPSYIVLDGIEYIKSLIMGEIGILVQYRKVVCE